MSLAIKHFRRDRPSPSGASDLRMARRSRRVVGAMAIAASPPLVSGKNLDFLSLTLCSCALALLCHSAANPPQANSANPNSMAQSRPIQGSGATLQPYTLPASRPSLKAKGQKGA